LKLQTRMTIFMILILTFITQDKYIRGMYKPTCAQPQKI
jgi:hypothetical protein